MSKFSLTAQLNLQAPKNTKQVLNQIKSDLKGVSVPIEAKGAAKAVKDLNKLAKSTKEVQKQTKAAAGQFDLMGKAVGRALTHVARFDVARRIFYGFASAIEQGITDAIQFEREMIKVAQVAQTTLKGISGLNKTIDKLARGLGVSAQSLAKTSLILKQTGLSIRDVQIAMEALAKTELAPTFDNIATTAETAVAAMRQFGIEANKLEGLLSKINTVAGQFAVESRDIGQAIIRTGGAFKAAGGSVEELIALFTSVRSTTRETAETIATGFRTIFTRLQRPKTIEFLRQFGIELTDLNGKFVGPYEAVARLSNALQGLSSTDLRFSMIVEQLGGFRQVSKVIPLIQQFTTAQAAMQAQMEGGDSLARDAAKAQDALAVKLAKVKEEMKSLMREVVSSDGFKVMAETAMMLARALVKVGEAVAPLIPLLTAMATIKLGKMALGGIGAIGRKQAGGRISRFSQGGWVPGSGNGDTVPALLEPGEFVLRKSAAQAFGPALDGVNKYASGGNISSKPSAINTFYNKMGLMYSKAGKISHKKFAKTPWSDSINFTPTDDIGINNTVQSVKLTTRNFRSNAGNAALAKAYLDAGDDRTKGKHWESMLRKTGTLSQEGPIKSGRGPGPDMDGFLSGTKGLADAALSARSHTNAHLIAKAMSAVGSQGLNRLRLTTGKDDVRLPINTTELTPDRGVDKWLRNYLAQYHKPKKKKATGGGIFGSGLSPVLLTPGEFVVNKSSARSIGYGKLGSMNKYATGGKVGKGGVKRFFGGGMMGAGGVMGGMSPMAMVGYTEANKSAGDLSRGLMEAASSAMFIKAAYDGGGAAVKSFADQLGVGGEGLDLFVDSITKGLGTMSAVNAVSAKIPKEMGAAIGKIPGLVDPSKVAEGGFLGTKQATRREQADEARKASVLKEKSIRSKFKEEQGVRDERLAEVSAISEKKKAQREAMVVEKAEREGISKAAAKDALQAKGKKGKYNVLTSEIGEIGDEKRSIAGKNRYEKAKMQRDTKSQRSLSDKHKATSKEAANAAKKMKALSAAINVGIGALGAFGDKLMGDAMKGIEEGDVSGGKGERMVERAAIGGALSTGAQGAQMGQILGPWGMAIGAAVGATWGFINAQKEAEKALKARRLSDAVNDMSETIEKFNKGEINAGKGLQEILKARDDARGNFASAEEATGFQTKQRVATEAMVKSMADGASSVGQFRSTLDPSRASLEKHGLITDKLVQKMEDEITARLKSQKLLEEAAAARREELDTIRRAKGIATVLEEATYRVDEFSQAVESAADPLGKVNFGGGLAGKMRLGSGDKTSVERMNKMFDRMGQGGIAGEAGAAGISKEAVEGAKAAGFVERNINAIAMGAAGSGALGSEGRLADALEQQFKAALTREEKTTGYKMPEEERKRMTALMREAGEDTELGKKLEDPLTRDSAIEELNEKIKGEGAQLVETFKKVAEAIDKNTKRLHGLLLKRNQLEAQYADNVVKIISMRFDAEQEYARNTTVSKFGGPTNERVQANFRSRQAAILEGGGVDTSMAGNVKALTGEFGRVRKALDKSNQDLSQGNIGEGTSLAEGMNKLATENASLKKQYGALKTALEDNTNTTQRLSALQESLKREQEKQKTLEQLTFDAAYGTAEEKDTAARLINAMNTAMQAGTVSAVDPSQQRQVARMLMTMGPDGEKIVRKDQNKFLGMSGVAPTAAGGVDYQGITSVSETQLEIAREIAAIREEGASAAEALNQIDIGGNIGQIKTAIEAQTTSFIAELRNLLTENAKKENEQDKAVNDAASKGLDEAASEMKVLGYSVGANQESSDRLLFLDSTATNLANRAESLRKMDTKMKSAPGMTGHEYMRGGQLSSGMGVVNQLMIEEMFDELDKEAIGGSDNFLDAAKDQMSDQVGSGEQTAQEAATAAAMMSRMIASGPEVTAKLSSRMLGLTSGSRTEVTGRQFTQADIDMNKSAQAGDVVALGEMEKRVRERFIAPLEELGGVDDKQMQDLKDAVNAISETGGGKVFEQQMAKVAAMLAQAERDQEIVQDTVTVGYGEAGSKRDADYAKSIEKSFMRRIQLGQTEGAAGMELEQLREIIPGLTKEERALGAITEVGGQKIASDELNDDARMAEIIAKIIRERIIDYTGKDAPAFVEKRKRTTEQDAKIKQKEMELDAIEKEPSILGDQAASSSGAPVDTIASSSLEQEKFLKGLYEEGVQKKSSIAVHDAHCEKILTTIANALTGGEGTAANPTSETGGVAFTQSLDSRGFQDGVDKFSQTVDGLREVMAGALTIEVGGTVTLDINLKEGAGFLQDSQNALGILVSGKINDAINNFIRNGLKDARINTGSWAADDSGTALSSNSNTSGGMGLS